MVEINSSKLKCAFNVLIVVIFTSYLFFNINTYVHEKGHQEAFLEKGIDSEINLNHNVVGSGGITQFNSKDDCENFNSLSKKNKNKIFFAGIKSELMLLSVLLIMLFLIQIKANKKSLNNYYIKWALLLFIIIIY